MKPQISLSSINDILLQFYQSRKSQLIQHKCNYLLRWARYCSFHSVSQMIFPNLSMRLERLDHEYEDSLLRLQRLESAISSQCLHNSSLLFLSNDTLRVARNTPTISSQATASHAQTVPLPANAQTSQNSTVSTTTNAHPGSAIFTSLVHVVQPDDIRILLRETVQCTRVTRRLNRFLSLIHFLPFTHRYALAARAASIVRTPYSPEYPYTDWLKNPSLPSHTEGSTSLAVAESLHNSHIHSNTLHYCTFISPTPLPTLISTLAELSAVLQPIATRLHLGSADASDFAFTAARAFGDAIAQHVRRMQRPLYSQCSLFPSLASTGTEHKNTQQSRRKYCTEQGERICRRR